MQTQKHDGKRVGLAEAASHARAVGCDSVAAAEEVIRLVSDSHEHQRMTETQRDKVVEK